MTDNVTAQIQATGGAVARKLERLRDAADHAMIGSPAHQQYGAFYDAWQNGDSNDRERLQRAAEAEEVAAQAD